MAGTSQFSISTEQSVLIRRASPGDAELCGNCFEAFARLADQHNFPRDFLSSEIPIHVLSTMFSHPAFFCVVAEQNGKAIGSNCLDERTPIAGVGPITIDPAAQNRAVARQLMQAVMTRATERKFAGIRLVQAAYHNRSLSLYAKLGFVVREPLSCMQGPAIQKILPGYQVRPAQARDLATCNDLCLRVHGHDRGGELNDAFNKAQPSSSNTEECHCLRVFGCLFRPRGWRDERRFEGTHCRSTRFSGVGDSCAHSQRGTVSLVSRERPSRRSTHDFDDGRTLQRTGWRVLAVHSVLTRI